MNPGTAQILTCPHCGAKKEVLSLLSGNNIDQQVWSDNKTIAPMLPRVSFVQKCPSCGGFYLMSRQTPEYGDDYSFELGELSYFETKEAWNSLKETLDLSEGERLTMLFMLVWAYNDEFTRESAKPIIQEEQDFFHGIIDLLLESQQLDILLNAELLREAGRFEESRNLLNGYTPDDEFRKKLTEKLIERIQALDTQPFLISDLFPMYSIINVR